ncbi:Maf-like protein [Muriicola sp. Z0-33]|uniref:Maf-like protein n=1 Tax=Muriicola sp. Z0-33 TaxID=2816957 RepID=UPI0022377B83|nr:Maf-like protein [Muriicola sp. Z0-33]MCW5515516.1 septum formation protein Maf [Muriicola sp. Z0-33]
MLKEKLKHHHIILASGSPRRRKFFEELGIEFEVRLKPVEEVYPTNLEAEAIARYLAILKAGAFDGQLHPNDILITSDTIVWHNGHSLSKPKDLNEACSLLQKLSGDTHKVITAVCFTTASGQHTLHDTTEVTFKSLSEEEINYYVSNFSPTDKAGAYGIQEWIGLIGIDNIKGSYYNVMGLPTHLVYKTLMSMVG